jgi:agmatine deiminase
MPAEWEPHEATWLAWPHESRDWPGKLPAIHWVYVEIVRLLHGREQVRILVEDARREKSVRRLLTDAGVDLDKITFFHFPTDRSWVRDSGPIFVRNRGEVAATCWRFNAWAKYDNWRRDASIPRKIARSARVRHWEPHWQDGRVVLEGGAIDVNGSGSLLTTEECLLGEVQQRNPGMSRSDWEGIFAEYLGVRHVLWLGRGIAGDDTHGHVDDLARFVAPRRVVTVVETDRRDPNYAPLRDNLRRLKNMTDQDGHRLEVVGLPMPRPLIFRGQRLPASYANFYIANGLVLVPTFNDPSDRVALRTLARLFPGREIVGVHSVDLVWGFGTLHCGTQQQPRAE